MSADIEFYPSDSVDDGVAVLEPIPDDTDTVVGFGEPLTTDEAQELTEHIRSTADVLYVLLARAHAGRAWTSLGYSTFADYVREEFDMSRSRAYQILDQHKVIAALEEALPEGTTLKISEAQARDLKSVIDEVVPAVRDATAGTSSEEAQKITDEIVEDFRQKSRTDIEEEADFDNGRPSGGLPGQFGGGGTGGIYDDDDYGDDDPEPAGMSVEDATQLRMRVQAAYSFYTAVSTLHSLPDVDFVIESISSERFPQVNEEMPTALHWLTKFADVWNERHNMDDENE